MRQLVLSIVVVLLCACGAEAPKNSSVKKPTIKKEKYKNEGIITFYGKKDTSVITFELADTREEIETGLMYRKFMPDSVGMLFKFPTMQMRSFWMRNTNISLDIIYVKNDFIIENIETQAQPFSEYSLPSTGPAQYVIEVNGGYALKHGIAKDAQVKIEYK